MDDYIACAECGHPLEIHHVKGCGLRGEGCTCTTLWRKQEVMRLRQEAGLPARFNRRDY